MAARGGGWMSKSRIKVIQGYTGTIAKAQIRMIDRHSGVELVGVLVHHEDKVGLDAGEIAGIDPLGVVATDRLDDILAMEADVVLYNPPTDTYTDVIPMLASGKNVITSTGGTNAKLSPDYASLVNACEAGESSFMGSGINPGYAPDVLPMVASALCARVDRVHVFAGGNVSHLDAAGLRLMGFGETPGKQAEDSVFIDHVVGSYQQTTRFLAEALSLKIDGLLVEPEFEPALHDIDGALPIAKGQTAGIRLSLVGTIGEQRVAILENTWFMGRENVRDSWLGPARDRGWTVKVYGDPDIELNVDVVSLEDSPRGGSQLTAARIFNSIPAVCSAPPGVLTYLDVPIPRVWQ
jgi:hypothetical protein